MLHPRPRPNGAHFGDGQVGRISKAAAKELRELKVTKAVAPAEWLAAAEAAAEAEAAAARKRKSRVAVSCPASACRQDDGDCGPGQPQAAVCARPVGL